MIVMQQVYKTFGSFEALKAINLSINKGEIHGIVGQSGAGKSTLLRLINKLESPDHGQVQVAGLALNKLHGSDLYKLRQSIGMIFQHYNLLSNKTVYANVELALQLVNWNRAQRKKRVYECLSFVGLADMASKYPAQLSGGQKQRVAIARSLANNPSILLCDEPTSSLDAKTTMEILEVLKQINEQLGLTIVIVSHEIDVIKSICNRVTVMDAGSIYNTVTVKATGLHKGIITAEDIVSLLKEEES